MNNPFFNVEERPHVVVIDGKEEMLEESKLIINADSGTHVSTVGKGYRLIPFGEVNQRITEALDRLGLSYTTKHNLSNGQKKLYSDYTLLDERFQFAPRRYPNDKSQGRICTLNSYDSSSSFMAAWGLFRGICSNGMVLGGKSEFNEKVYHTIGANYADMINRMFNNLSSFNMMHDFYNALAEYDIRQKDGNDLIDKLIPDNTQKTIKVRIENRVKLERALQGTEEPELPEGYDGKVEEPYGKGIGVRRRELVKALWNKPQNLLPEAEQPRNLWTLYNCFTNVITHEIESPNTRHNLNTTVASQFQQLVRNS